MTVYAHARPRGLAPWKPQDLRLYLSRQARGYARV